MVETAFRLAGIPVKYLQMFQGICLTVKTQAVPAQMEPDLMETVCLNLLDNARKAMETGGSILLEGFAEEAGCCIQVTDTGKGIPPEELERVTEAFYMVDNPAPAPRAAQAWAWRCASGLLIFTAVRWNWRAL